MGKILNKVNIQEELSHIKSNFQKLVFTNGCFDILHIGHVRFLKEAKKLGDKLIIAVNSDKSVKLLKGHDRPYNNENDRMEILSSLECVDYVYLFNEKRVSKSLEIIKPNVYAKGGDYTNQTLNSEEGEILKKIKAEVYILNLTKGKSTTNIINKINHRL